MLRHILVLCILPGWAFAVGSDDDAPKPTPTSETCEAGQIWDEETNTCSDAKDARLTDDDRIIAVRELAYAGSYSAALIVLDAMTDDTGDEALAYRGFLLRKAGDVTGAMTAYHRALSINPDNNLARSYRAMAYVEAGELRLARAELAEIYARGGKGSWPARALEAALTGDAVYQF